MPGATSSLGRPGTVTRPGFDGCLYSDVFAGRWIGSKFPPENSVKAALAVWLVYFLMDIAIVTAAGVLVSMGVVIAISLATKLAGAWLGGRSAQTRAANINS